MEENLSSPFFKNNNWESSMGIKNLLQVVSEEILTKKVKPNKIA